MTIVTLTSGIEIDASSGLRILKVRERYYVVGRDLLISAKSRKEAQEEIIKLKSLDV